MTQLSKLDKRIPQWDMKDLISRTCPICGSSGEATMLRPDKLPVVACASCHTYYVSPAPSMAQLRRFYTSYDNSHRNLPRLSGAELLQLYSRTNPAADYRFTTITSIRNPEAARVLDVGFGRGFFLYFLKQCGAQVAGIELDDQAIYYAKEHLDIGDVRKLDALNLELTERYDIILMMDLIEHVLRPFEYFQFLSERLNPGGIISIFTPNASHLRDQADPIQLRVDLEHLQYFSNTTCNFLARKLKLEIVHLENIGHPYLAGITMENGTKSLRSRTRRAVHSIPGVSKLFAPLARMFRANQLRSGNYHLFCVFRKPT